MSVYEFVDRKSNLIGIIVQVIGLCFVSYQIQISTAQIQISTAGLNAERKKELFAQAERLYNHKQNTNKLLLDRPIAAKNLHMPTEEELLGYALINDYDNLFLMRCHDLLGNSIWSQVEIIIYNELKPGYAGNNHAGQGTLRDFWDRYKTQYTPSFQKYVEGLTASSQQITTGVDKNTCDHHENS